MKSYNNILIILSLLVMVTVSACSDFEDLNKNPRDVGSDNVQPEYFLNYSIYNAQQNPHIAERMFILTWKYAARFERGSGFTMGTDNNGWVSDYYGIDAGTGGANGFLNNVGLAISIGEEHIANGTELVHTQNIVQIARIWRAYLKAELACGFGPLYLDGEYVSEKDIFYYVLNELKDAASKLDPQADMTGAANYDLFYKGDVTKWIKYANSLRMRYAMLLSVVDNAKAKAEFEDAAQGNKILTI